MSVRTTYDDKRDELKDTLKDALKQAQEMVIGIDIWGYDEYRDGYAMDVYIAIRNALGVI